MRNEEKYKINNIMDVLRTLEELELIFQKCFLLHAIAVMISVSHVLYLVNEQFLVKDYTRTSMVNDLIQR